MSSSPERWRGHGVSNADGGSVVFHLKGGTDAPVEARRALQALNGSIPAEIREDVLLLMTELVTNAVLHGGVGPEGSLSTVVRWRPGRVWVKVTNPSPAPEDFGAHRDDKVVGGWGLVLVDQIAHRWGIKRRSSGTTVWFELRS